MHTCTRAWSKSHALKNGVLKINVTTANYMHVYIIMAINLQEIIKILCTVVRM